MDSPTTKKLKTHSVPGSPERDSSDDEATQPWVEAKKLEDEFKANADVVSVRIVSKTVTLWKKRTTVPFNLPRGSWTKVIDIYGREKRPPVLGQGMVSLSWQVYSTGLLGMRR